MDQRDTWSPGAKVLTASVVGLLLSFGLCSVGSGWNDASSIGSILFLVSVLGFGVGIVMFLFTDR